MGIDGNIVNPNWEMKWMVRLHKNQETTLHYTSTDSNALIPSMRDWFNGGV